MLGSICEAAEARKVRLNLGMLVELHGGKIKMSLFQFQRDRQAVLSGKAGEKMFVTPIPVTVLSREEGRRLLEE